jgi:hypothetical protein
MVMLTPTMVFVTQCGKHVCKVVSRRVDLLRHRSSYSPAITGRVRLVSSVDNRSITGQIEHWAKIGKCAEENPELTYRLVRDILIGIEELDQGESCEYRFG